jgi:hypothetical protein
LAEGDVTQLEPGQVWLAWDVGKKLKGWRLVGLLDRHPHRLGASWRCADVETGTEVWLDESRWTSKKWNLVMPREEVA